MHPVKTAIVLDDVTEAEPLVSEEDLSIYEPIVGRIKTILSDISGSKSKDGNEVMRCASQLLRSLLQFGLFRTASEAKELIPVLWRFLDDPDHRERNSDTSRYHDREENRPIHEAKVKS